MGRGLTVPPSDLHARVYAVHELTTSPVKYADELDVISTKGTCGGRGACFNVTLWCVFTNFQTFFGLVPLYIGVEVVLGIAILNKAAGFYGFLSIITGHPINFLQWLYNIMSLLCLPFYILAIRAIKIKPQNGRKISLACVVYVIDTVIGVFYIMYFIHFWFANEEVVRRDLVGSDDDMPLTTSSYAMATPTGVGAVDDHKTAADPNQLVSPAHEIFMTLAGTVIFTVIRFYFTLIMLAFNKALLKQLKVEERDAKDEEEERILLGSGFWNKVQRVELNWENRAKQFMTDQLLNRWN